MKTPEETKKELERCKHDAHCDSCLNAYHCQVDADTLALIQQLEADNAEKDKRIRQLEAERDAAVADIRLAFTSYVGTCLTCKHGENQVDCIEPLRCGNCENEKCKCQSCDSYDSNWEWRGVQKEDGNAKSP